MRTTKNLLAGFTNAAWSAILGLAVLPIYLKYLGIESYGLIGFSVMMQSVMSLLDMGITPTINREIARFAAKGKLQEAGKLLHTLAVIYWCIGAIIAVSILLLAPFISEYWLESKKLPKETILHAVMLMGLIVACRFPISIYQGVLIGAQRITVSSAISITITTISYVGAILILEYVSKTIYAFFIWQACIGLIYAFSMRGAAWKIIGRTKKIHFDINQIKLIWRFSLAMCGIAVSSVILVQIDKVLLSKFLSLEEFGCYVLAGTVASSISLLIGPTFQVIYPRLSALTVEKNLQKQVQYYREGSRLFCAVLFPATITAVLFSKDFLFIWTKDMSLASQVEPILCFLLFGTAVNGVMIFPYAIQLASGLVKLPLIIVGVMIIIYIPLVIYLTLTYGVIGGSIAWAILNILNFMLGTWLTHQKILKGIGLNWVLSCVLLPFCVSLIVVLIGWRMFYIEGSYGQNLIIGSLLILFTIALNFRLLIWKRNEKNMKLNKKIKSFLKKSKLIINLYQIITAIKLLIFDVCSSLLSRSLKVKMTPYGFKLLGSNLVHHIDMQNGVFEPDETTLFKDIFKGIDIFVDVGANIGFYACMARAAGLHVIAIEPQQKNLKYLYANIKENEWSDVEIFPVGLASQYGIATLFGGSSTGASLISNWAGASKMFHQIIPLSTLDILLGGRFLGKKIFIKINVEGAEYSALLGGITLMDMLPKPTWVVEICLNEYHPEGINPNFEEIFKLFWRHGYEARTADKKDRIILQKDIELWIKNGKCDSETINYKFTPIE